MKQPTVPTEVGGLCLSTLRALSNKLFGEASIFSSFLILYILVMPIVPAEARIVEMIEYGTVWDDPHAQFYTDFDCDDLISGGGTYLSDNGVSGNPSFASGLPDEHFTGKISGNDDLTLSFPDLEAGADLSVTLGFSSKNGKVILTLNGIEYYFNNPERKKKYKPQIICIPTTEDGEQILIIKDNGSGSIKVDGSTYEGCDGSGSENNNLDEQYLIDSLQADNPDSYVILAENKVELKNNTINTGGIGVWTGNKKIEVGNNSEIASFLRADKIEITNNSDRPNLPKILSPAPLPILEVPPFSSIGNAPNLKIKKNQPDTTIIDGAYYKKIEIEENNHVLFTRDTVYIDELKIKDGKKNKEIFIDFNVSTVLVVKKKVKIGKKVFFNAA